MECLDKRWIQRREEFHELNLGAEEMNSLREKAGR